jgi:hypothetical protein
MKMRQLKRNKPRNSLTDQHHLSLAELQLATFRVQDYGEDPQPIRLVEPRNTTSKATFMAFLC